MNPSRQQSNQSNHLQANSPLEGFCLPNRKSMALFCFLTAAAPAQAQNTSPETAPALPTKNQAVRVYEVGREWVPAHFSELALPRSQQLGTERASFAVQAPKNQLTSIIVTTNPGEKLEVSLWRGTSMISSNLTSNFVFNDDNSIRQVTTAPQAVINFIDDGSGAVLKIQQHLNQAQVTSLAAGQRVVIRPHPVDCTIMARTTPMAKP